MRLLAAALGALVHAAYFDGPPAAGPILGAVMLWAETDDRVLRWVASRPFSYADSGQLITLSDGEPLPPDSPELEGLDWKQIDASLRRLAGKPYEFIAGTPGPAGVTGTVWSKLRIRAEGLQQLDEWPDFDRIASARGMQMMLDELATVASDPGDKSLLQKAGGIAGRFADRFIRGGANTLTVDAAKQLGKEL